MYTVERYRAGRFWALYDGRELVCVTVYKKGANAVKERLERLRVLPPASDKPPRGRHWMSEEGAVSRTSVVSQQGSTAKCFRVND